jgi:hypothetical protein
MAALIDFLMSFVSSGELTLATYGVGAGRLGNLLLSSIYSGAYLSFLGETEAALTTSVLLECLF